MSEYVKCITMEGDTFTLCGRLELGFTFQGIDHAYNEAARDGRLCCCPKCAEIVINELTAEPYPEDEDGEA